jgi:hypothetical protein
MLLRQSFKMCADVMKLLNFVENRLESHGWARFMGLRGSELQMEHAAPLRKWFVSLESTQFSAPHQWW